MVPALVTEETVLHAVASATCPVVAFEIARRLHSADQHIDQPDIDTIATTARRHVPEIVRQLHRQGRLDATPDGMTVLAILAVDRSGTA